MGTTPERRSTEPVETGTLFLSPQELEAIARKVAWSGDWPAPLGGRRWTCEDVHFAVSLLALETGARGFLQAVRQGMSRVQAGKYLLKALRNRLLKRERRIRWVRLLDDTALDRLPALASSRPKLHRKDALELALRVVRRLSPKERDALSRHLDMQGTEARLPGGPEGSGVSRRTHAKRWARARDCLRDMASDAALSLEDLAGVLRALSVVLASAR